jgi:hypothetical protein
LARYINDDAVELALVLVWCGEMNILPTAANPLTGLNDYNGRKSNISRMRSMPWSRLRRSPMNPQNSTTLPAR